MKRKRTFKRRGRLYRVCTGCEQELPIGRFSVAVRDENGEIAKWSYACKRCAVKRKAAWRRKVRAENPAQWERMRNAEMAQQRRWRKANPDKATAAIRRYRAKLKAEPKRHAAFLETRRIEYALRCERRNGQKVTGKRKRYSTAVRLSGEHRYARYLPAAPLVVLIETLAQQAEVSYPDMAERLGVQKRTAYAWQAGERELASVDVADQVLTATRLNWHDVFDEPTVERLTA